MTGLLPLIIPAEVFAAISPSDTVNLATGPTRGIYVGGSGDLKVLDIEGTATTFTSLAAGVIHAIRATRVYSTGTTATNIVGIW